MNATEREFTATASLRIDRRRLRVQPLLHAIMEKVRPRLADERDLRFIYDEIGQMLFEAGAEIITDAQRADAGLPPRGPDGWTAQELLAMEKFRLDVITRPLFMEIQK